MGPFWPQIQIASWNIPSSGSGGSGVNWFGDRGTTSGGHQINNISYYAIPTGNQAQDFGDLTASRNETDACSSPTRGLVWGGYAGGLLQSIDYFTITTTGNAQDFGDMTKATYWGGACSSGVRGCYYNSGSNQNIDYVTIATTGNAQDFGDLHSGHSMRAVSNGTIGLWGGGYYQSPSDGQNTTISYITFDTLGNGTTFGNLTQGSYRTCGAASDATYGLWGGGDSGPSNWTQSNGIEYITMATAGNSTDFGDLTAIRRYCSATNSGTIGIWIGGTGTTSGSDQTVDKVTITTPGNATDWGDTVGHGHREIAACSGNAS